MKTVHPSSILVSRETKDRLNEYAALLLKWNAKINLISATTESDIWHRHLDDCLQLLSLIPSDAKTLIDLGSGAGLPGLVIAISRPDLSVTLVEQDQRKSAFLNEVKARLSLDNVSIITTDIAKLHTDKQYDVITARALASLATLCSMAKPLMHRDSICLFPKGEAYVAELGEAEKHWQFLSALKPSATHDKSSIITISKLTTRI